MYLRGTSCPTSPGPPAARCTKPSHSPDPGQTFQSRPALLGWTVLGRLWQSSDHLLSSYWQGSRWSHLWTDRCCWCRTPCPTWPSPSISESSPAIRSPASSQTRSPGQPPGAYHLTPHYSPPSSQNVTPDSQQSPTLTLDDFLLWNTQYIFLNYIISSNYARFNLNLVGPNLDEFKISKYTVFNLMYPSWLVQWQYIERNI